MLAVGGMAILKLTVFGDEFRLFLVRVMDNVWYGCQRN